MKKEGCKTMATTLKREEIESYNKKRQQIIDLNSKKEAQYQITMKDIDTKIAKLNEMLIEDGILDIVITRDNFKDVYKQLKAKAEKDYAEGMKIMEQETKEYQTETE